MLPSRNTAITNYSDWLRHVIQSLPDNNIKWKVIVPMRWGAAKELFKDWDTIDFDKNTITIHNKSHKIRFHKSVKYLDVVIDTTKLSYIELVKGEYVIQQHAFSYYMNKYKIANLTELYLRISYPVHKLKRMFSHEYYCDSHCSNLLSHLTSRSENFWRKLQR